MKQSVRAHSTLKEFQSSARHVGLSLHLLCQVSALVTRVALDLITASQTQSRVDVWGCCHRKKALYTSRKVEAEVHTGSVALRKPNDTIMEEVGCMEPGTGSLCSSA